MRPPRSFSFWLGAGVLTALVLAAVLAPLLAPYGPAEAGPLNAPPSVQHPLGTTGQGFDVLSQFVYGARTSFLVSFSVAGLTTLVGIVVGLVSAYAGGWVDDVLSLLTNVFLAIPGVPLMVVLAAFLPPGELTIILVLTFTGWSFGARLFRSQALSLREREFIAASRLAREARWRIIVVELLPNMLSITVAYLFNQVIYAITAEAGLEFLGLGHSSKVTWGTMLNWAQNDSALLQGYWWTFVVPGLGIALTASALALINHAVDEKADPRLRAAPMLRQAFGLRTRSASLITPVVNHD